MKIGRHSSDIVSNPRKWEEMEWSLAALCRRFKMPENTEGHFGIVKKKNVFMSGRPQDPLPT